MYISHLLHASFIPGTGRTAMPIFICDQWQKFKLMWKDGGAVAILNKLATEGPTEKVTLTQKPAERNLCARLSLRLMIHPESRRGKEALRCECGWSDIVEQEGSMVGAQRGRGETGTQL